MTVLLYSCSVENFDTVCVDVIFFHDWGVVAGTFLHDSDHIVICDSPQEHIVWGCSPKRAGNSFSCDCLYPNID